MAGVGYLVTVAPAHARAAAAGRARRSSCTPSSSCARTGSTLYGFPDPADRTWFRLLQTVQGVGARVALSLLGTLRPHELANAIAAGDKAMLARATGVGAAAGGADRGRAQGPRRRSAASAGRVEAAGGSPCAAPSGDALSALLHLGYGRAEAYAALARVQAPAGRGGWPSTRWSARA